MEEERRIICSSSWSFSRILVAAGLWQHCIIGAACEDVSVSTPYTTPLIFYSLAPIIEAVLRPPGDASTDTEKSWRGKVRNRERKEVCKKRNGMRRKKQKEIECKAGDGKERRYVKSKRSRREKRGGKEGSEEVWKGGRRADEINKGEGRE
ncbi:hypothetical protein Pmani_003276 [Petrolisthes manimaculis]|uniref:Uncharacterized protein n=1 Tax=Petrolisthes manimaculis TaxID=1843537 RepID=A0AAE1UMN2_9EUCA|nr:hypothetical protein Pmani_003276 [Petrolisthes manimaculis]